MVTWTQELFCPYCWASQDSEMYSTGKEESQIVQCENCDKKFILHTFPTTVFATEKYDENNIQKR